MISSADQHVAQFMSQVQVRNPNEPEFLQAVREVVESVLPFARDNQKYVEATILERMTEPDRILSFRVCWRLAGNE